MASKKKKKKQEQADDKLLAFLKTAAMIIVYSISLLFIVVNIWSSQHVPQLFFDLANDDEKSVVELLTKAKDTKQYKYLFPEVQQVISKNSEAIYKESNDRSVQIQTLRALLELNPESPEILYSLHVLYRADKDMVNAAIYLQKARMIDPQIGL